MRHRLCAPHTAPGDDTNEAPLFAAYNWLFDTARYVHGTARWASLAKAPSGAGQSAHTGGGAGQN